jgi:hypothetical protein
LKPVRIKCKTLINYLNQFDGLPTDAIFTRQYNTFGNSYIEPLRQLEPYYRSLTYLRNTGLGAQFVLSRQG